MNQQMRENRARAQQRGIVFIPHKFEECPMAEVLGVIGKQRYRDLLTKAGANGWSQDRIEMEARNLADEVFSQKDE